MGDAIFDAPEWPILRFIIMRELKIQFSVTSQPLDIGAGMSWILHN
jgi:hypothetical protein